jgi:alpha-methylacyl-CoA racemase
LLERDRYDPVQWPSMRERIAAVFRTRTRDEWSRDLEGTDTCFAPVLTMAEALRHPHNAHRGTFVAVDGATQPAPAPRFSRTVTDPPTRAARPGEHTREALAAWGLASDRIESLIDAGAVLATDGTS